MLKNLSILLTLVYFLNLQPAFSAESCIKEDVIEFPNEGEPIGYKAYLTKGKVTKIEIIPSVSSHALKITGVFDNDGKLILVTIDMWEFLDDQANPIKTPKYHSIWVYAFKDKQISYRSSKEECLYIPEKNIHPLLTEFKGFAEKKADK